MREILILLFIFGSILAQGQKLEIQQYFDFKDGLYFSHEALLRNDPSIALTSDTKGVYNNPLKILRVNPIEFGLKADSEIAYVVEQGLPYARVIRCCPDQVIYVGLTIVGHLSILVFDSEEIVDVPMTAYNPYNNKPFLKGTVKREKSIRITKVIDFTSGDNYEIGDDTLSTILGTEDAIQDLEDLIEKVSEFNKRNKVYIVQE